MGGKLRTLRKIARKGFAKGLARGDVQEGRA